MRTAVILVSCFLWIWFFGAVFTWRFGKVLLVEGMGVKSMEFAVLVLFGCGVAAYILFEPLGRYILSAELALWLIVQFFCHEYFTLFGASERKIKGYNECFRGTVKVLAPNETRIVPDLFHIVQHLLILTDLVLCLMTL